MNDTWHWRYTQCDYWLSTEESGKRVLESSFCWRYRQRIKAEAKQTEVSGTHIRNRTWWREKEQLGLFKFLCLRKKVVRDAFHQSANLAHMSIIHAPSIWQKQMLDCLLSPHDCSHHVVPPLFPLSCLGSHSPTYVAKKQLGTASPSPKYVPFQRQ